MSWPHCSGRVHRPAGCLPMARMLVTPPRAAAAGAGGDGLLRLKARLAHVRVHVRQAGRRRPGPAGVDDFLPLGPRGECPGPPRRSRPSSIRISPAASRPQAGSITRAPRIRCFHARCLPSGESGLSVARHSMPVFPLVSTNINSILSPPVFSNKKALPAASFFTLPAILKP